MTRKIFLIVTLFTFIVHVSAQSSGPYTMCGFKKIDEPMNFISPSGEKVKLECNGYIICLSDTNTNQKRYKVMFDAYEKNNTESDDCGKNGTNGGLSICAKVENASECSNIAEAWLGFEPETNEFISVIGFVSPNYVNIANYNVEDGSFRVDLSETVNSIYLYPLIVNDFGEDRWQLRVGLSIYTASLASTIISNKNVKVVCAELMGIGASGSISGGGPYSLFVERIDENNFTKVIFTYVDSDVIVSGDNLVNGRHNSYSIEWKKGWNVSYLSGSVTVGNDGKRIFNTKWTSIPSSKILKLYCEQMPLRL